MTNGCRDFENAIREDVEKLKVFNPLGDSSQDKVFAFYVGRAVELGEAALRLFDLPTPLAAVARALCEDAITTHFASLSEQNAAECLMRAENQQRRYVRTLLLSGNSKVDENIMGELLPVLQNENLRTDALEEIAKRSGLQILYDRYYRLSCLEFHGSFLGSDEKMFDTAFVAAGISAVALKIISLVVGNKGQILDAKLISDSIAQCKV